MIVREDELKIGDLPVNKIVLGDALDVLKKFPDNSIDAVVTDPPYALINESGSGFMGQDWDSFKYQTEEKYLFEVPLTWFRKFARIVEEYLKQNMIEVSLDEVSFVQGNVCMNISPKHDVRENYLNVQYAVKNSTDLLAELKRHKLFIAQENVLTKEEVLVLQKELSLNLINEEKNQKFVLYVVRNFTRERKLRNIAQENVSKNNTVSICVEKIIPLTSMDEAKIRNAIEGIIGKRLEERYIKEIIGHVKSAERNVIEKKYNVTILSRIKLLKIILQAISSRYVLNVTPLSKISIVKLRNTILPPTNFVEYLIGLDYKLTFDIKTKLELYQHWVTLWAKELLRVVKPGGHVLVFGATRTFHRLVSGLEDAGFEIRDMIVWLYGSGFNKGMDISKAIDKELGAYDKRKIIEQIPDRWAGKGSVYCRANQEEREVALITEPATPEAKQWQGWGTALKPACEPIVLARKPISEKNVARNVLKWGTGGLNVEATRINLYTHELIEMLREYRCLSKILKKGKNGVENMLLKK